MSRFFIDRPIFASVISIVIVLAGIMAARILPIAHYPEIAPPTVVISATYPGASAETLTKTVAAPIEEQLSGIENLAYFTSTAATNGTLNTIVTFDVGTDADMATVNVNNRVKAAEPRLPDVVRQFGVTVRKRSSDMLMIVSLTSPDGSRSRLFLSNYALVNMVDDLKRLPGVGDAQILGPMDYSMRVWLKPDRMAQLGITTTDIANALAAQNAQNAAGKIGSEPMAAGQQLVYTVTAKGRLVSAEEFGDIVIRADGPRGALRLRDVARLELGAQSYDAQSTLRGNFVVGTGIFLQPGANALEVANSVRAKMEELKSKFPSGVDYVVPLDTTKFIDASIKEVLQTLIEALVLVAVVVFVFLQNWRATIIPLLAVPISLIGTFAGLWLFGFSINTLTLFAMVLAIGIVVDDAIVVLENVERLMAEKNLSPKEAAIESMREVSSAVVAIVLVLSAVFIPVAFLGGIAGKLYQQFAVTVVISVIISGIVALTLTPALCALLLRKKHAEPAIFRPFNRAFAALTAFYTGLVNKTLRHRIIGTVVCLILLGGTTWIFRLVPGGFVPPEDQGFLISALTLPDGASLQRTVAAGHRYQSAIIQDPAVDMALSISGNDIIGGGIKTNAGTMFIPLKHWDQRVATADDLIKKFSMIGKTLPDGLALVFNPPSIRGLGSAGGFEAYIQARGDSSPQALATVTQNFMDTLKKHPELATVNTFFRPTSPQLYVEVNEAKAIAMGIAVADVYKTLQATMGTLYINDFNIDGRTYRVQLQADAAYRASPEDIGKVYVRAANGAMIPVSALITVRSLVGPELLDRFNGFLAAKVMGSALPQVSTGDTIGIVEEVARETLPAGYELAWTGQAYQEKLTGGTSAIAFIFGIVMVFLILAAQYERWSLPLAVIMAVPFALFGALLAVLLRGMPNDIYFQIGLVVLIGLASKNAILIVEFAAQKKAAGMDTLSAAIEAARLRFRPIVMTSLAFILGIVPLAFSSGAGSAARRSMGTGVFGGMLAATFVATIFIPMFFTWFADKKVGAGGTATAQDNARENAR
jgi:HAE1 family hydrophobic/amphiphilic exporter-1/multidrug efflux pump